mmetsp:Transcript_12748/g.35199  ORF Transcript_12748/g.35199 Transcript_12748/m.35199 type:complete len:116 (-) Transcript_12748:765-1112(-)
MVWHHAQHLVYYLFIHSQHPHVLRVVLQSYLICSSRLRFILNSVLSSRFLCTCLTLWDLSHSFDAPLLHLGGFAISGIWRGIQDVVGPKVGSSTEQVGARFHGTTLWMMGRSFCG